MKGDFFYWGVRSTLIFYPITGSTPTNSTK